MSNLTCQSCGLELTGSYMLDLHVSRLHRDTPEGAAKAREKALEEESRLRAEGNFQERTEPRSTFRERFTEAFQVLQDLGFGPRWEPLAEQRTYDFQQEASVADYRSSSVGDFGTKRAEVITCRNGPVISLELSIQTHDVGDELTYWQTQTEICFVARADWTPKLLQGLHALLIHLEADGTWDGNDLGLGIIDRLNGLTRGSSMLSGTKIDVGPGGRIQAAIPGPSTKGYSSGVTIPPLHWRIPGQYLTHALISVAGILGADPPYLPLKIIRPSEIPSVSSPRKYYLWWTGYPLLAGAIAGGGVGSIYRFGPENNERAIVLLGIVLLSVGVVVAFSGLGRLGEIRRGCKRFVGTLDRKWALQMSTTFESKGERTLSENHSIAPYPKVTL